MSALCPNPDTGCDACVDAFLDEHPGAELFQHTAHWCECPWIADVTGAGDGSADVCVGCREPRDIIAEWRRMRGAA